jgi:putative oxidoreductase
MSMKAPGRRTAQWARLILGTTSDGSALDAALVAVRIALAWIFIYYGAAKLFGAFPGPGPHGINQTATFMSQTAHLHPGTLFAVLAGVIEFGGGVAVSVGFATRLAGLALFGDMVMATITTTWSTGLNSTTTPPGYQLNVTLAALALVAALVGGGRISLDALLVRALSRRSDTDSSTAPSPTQRTHRTQLS